MAGLRDRLVLPMHKPKPPQWLGRVQLEDPANGSDG